MSDTSVLPADLSGRTLGDFRLLRRLGRGGMAEVYLAEQQSLKRQIAFKVLKNELAADPSYVQRFHLEAQAAASFVHANVVQIYEVGCVEGVHYIAQEYVQGQNLREVLSKNGPPELPLALRVMRHTAAALHQAAARGIVHRDIKPENIMISRSGEVKVADFGLARLTRDSAAVDLTQVGMTMGTPLYMSPEQVEGRPLDPRSDLYSLGVTCYHMLAGEPPFKGDTALAVAVQHLRRMPERLEHVRPDLPPAMSRIVHRLLAKDPAERYASALDLLRELRGVRIAGQEDDAAEWEDLAVETAAVAGRLEATARLNVLMQSASFRARRRRGRAWALAAVAAAAFGFGGTLSWAMRGPPLLADAAPSQTVPQLQTADLQWFLAQSQGTEESLLAVGKYFPQDQVHVRLAERELARLYLQQDRWEEALPLFDRFAAADPINAEDRAFGMAGRVVTLTLMNRYAEAAAELNDLYPVLDRLVREPEMSRLLGSSVERIRRDRNLEKEGQWEQWMQQQFGQEEPPEA